MFSKEDRESIRRFLRMHPRWGWIDDDNRPSLNNNRIPIGDSTIILNRFSSDKTTTFMFDNSAVQQSLSFGWLYPQMMRVPLGDGTFAIDFYPDRIQSRYGLSGKLPLTHSQAIQEGQSSMVILQTTNTKTFDIFDPGVYWIAPLAGIAQDDGILIRSRTMLCVLSRTEDDVYVPCNIEKQKITVEYLRFETAESFPYDGSVRIALRFASFNYVLLEVENLNAILVWDEDGKKATLREHRDVVVTLRSNGALRFKFPLTSTLSNDRTGQTIASSIIDAYKVYVGGYCETLVTKSIMGYSGVVPLEFYQRYASALNAILRIIYQSKKEVAFISLDGTTCALSFRNADRASSSSFQTNVVAKLPMISLQRSTIETLKRRYAVYAERLKKDPESVDPLEQFQMMELHNMLVRMKEVTTNKKWGFMQSNICHFCPSEEEITHVYNGVHPVCETCAAKKLK